MQVCDTITDTPEKEKLVSRCKKVSQKRPERTVFSSSESDISMHLLSDVEVTMDSTRVQLAPLPVVKVL